MNQNEIMQSLRAEIAKLQRVLDLLSERSSAVTEVRRPGRPKGSGNRSVAPDPQEAEPKKRMMSAEGKARIAAAQKKRWAAQKSAPSDRKSRNQVALENKASKAVPPRTARKPVTTTAKKSEVASKKPGSAPTTSAKLGVPGSPRKNASKKVSVKKTTRQAGKRPAKQVVSTGPELQATA